MQKNNKQLRRGFILASVMLGMFLAAIEATIVATAMPSIVGDLGGFSLYSWIFSAYLLTSASTVLIFGRLSDIYGRRPIYIIGTAIFLFGSILAGYSQTMVILIIARTIQGVGAGALMPIAMTIVGDIYSPEERAKIQGYLSSVWGISAIFGPLLGGLFVEHLNWRFVFWMNIPLGVLSVLGIIIFLREPVKRERQKVDYIGSVLMVSFVTLLMYMLVEGGVSIPWTSTLMLILTIIVLLLFTVFIYYEKRLDEPIMPLSIWSSNLIKVANFTALTTGMIIIGISSYLPTFVQGVLGQSAIIAGFTLTTMSIGWPIAATVAGHLLLVIGYRNTSLIGGVFLIVGTLFFVFLTTDSSPLLAGFGSFFVGIGMGLTSTSFIVSIQSTVGWETRGIATAIFTFMRSVGSALGVALLGGLLNNQIKSEIERENLSNVISVDSIDLLLNDNSKELLSTHAIQTLKAGLTSGLHIVYISILLLAILSLIIILFIPRSIKHIKKN